MPLRGEAAGSGGPQPPFLPTSAAAPGPRFCFCGRPGVPLDAVDAAHVGGPASRSNFSLSSFSGAFTFPLLPSIFPRRSSAKAYWTERQRRSKAARLGSGGGGAARWSGAAGRRRRGAVPGFSSRAPSAACQPRRRANFNWPTAPQIGRASCRERVLDHV